MLCFVDFSDRKKNYFFFFFYHTKGFEHKTLNEGKNVLSNRQNAKIPNELAYINGKTYFFFPLPPAYTSNSICPMRFNKFNKLLYYYFLFN